MAASQWIGLVILLLICGALALAFVRHGASIKPDPDSKPRSDPPGSGIG